MCPSIAFGLANVQLPLAEWLYDLDLGVDPDI